MKVLSCVSWEFSSSKNGSRSNLGWETLQSKPRSNFVRLLSAYLCRVRNNMTGLGISLPQKVALGWALFYYTDFQFKNDFFENSKIRFCFVGSNLHCPLSKSLHKQGQKHQWHCCMWRQFLPCRQKVWLNSSILMIYFIENNLPVSLTVRFKNNRHYSWCSRNLIFQIQGSWVKKACFYLVMWHPAGLG
jgi:hypothetical protein